MKQSFKLIGACVAASFALVSCDQISENNPTLQEEKPLVKFSDSSVKELIRLSLIHI